MWQSAADDLHDASIVGRQGQPHSGSFWAHKDLRLSALLEQLAASAASPTGTPSWLRQRVRSYSVVGSSSMRSATMVPLGSTASRGSPVISTS